MRVEVIRGTVVTPQGAYGPGEMLDLTERQGEALIRRGRVRRVAGSPASTAPTPALPREGGGSAKPARKRAGKKR